METLVMRKIKTLFVFYCFQVCDEPKSCEIDSTRIKDGENHDQNLVGRKRNKSYKMDH